MSWASDFFAATIGTWASKTSIEGAYNSRTGAPYVFGTPPAPIMFAAVAAGLTALVSFTDGGAGAAGPTLGYTVLAFKNGSPDATVIDSNAGSLSLTHTMTGLVDGQTYQFAAIANNIGGNSAQSALSNSITAVAVTLFPIDTRIVFEGDSRTVLPAAVSYALTLSVLMQGRFYEPSGYNQAVSGETLAQMAATGETSAVVARQGAIISVLAGVNDITAAAPANTAAANAAAATMFSNLQTMLAAYFASSFTQMVMVFKEPPSSVITAGAYETCRLAYNALLDTITDARVKVISSHLASWDYTTYDYDGLHPNWTGGYAYATAAFGVLNPLFATGDISADYLTNPLNLLVTQGKNPSLSGTTGTLQTNVTGVLATGTIATVTGTGITAVASKDTLADGSIAQRFVCSGTGAAIGNELQFSIVAITTAGSAAGDAYEIWMDFELAAGSAGIKGYGGTISNIASTPSIASTGLMGTEARSGRIRVSPYVYTATTANFFMTFKLRFDLVAVTADVKFGKPYARKVPAPNSTNP